MKLYRYWSKEISTLEHFSTKPVISCWGGSNVSIEEALTRAKEKMVSIKQRIMERRPLRRSDYEVEIREEIITEINPHNIVSRNRYGALVLNSEDTLFIDIDHAPTSLWDVFGRLFGKKRLSNKDAIIKMVEEKAAQPKYNSLSFRIYETASGIRVIVTGRSFDPKSNETRQIFREFNADGLYAHLCHKQNCFRARLTPKPHRVKVPRHKVIYPRNPEEDAALAAWLKQYEAASNSSAVCRFVRSVGSGGDNPIVSYHDQAVGAHKSWALA